jgi:hypothetical protein
VKIGSGRKLLLKMGVRPTMLFLLSVVAVAVHISQAQEARTPPVMTVQPVSGYFVYQNFSIYCEATGQPTPVYTWIRNETQVLVMNQTTGSYVLPSNTFAENGYYVCYATNKWGRAVSRTAFLQKAFINGFPDNNIENSAKGPRDSLAMYCRNPGQSVPPPVFNWGLTDTSQTFKGTVPVDDRIQYDNVIGTLHFANVKSEDMQTASPLYTCLTDNAVSSSVQKGSYTRLNVTGTVKPAALSTAFRIPTTSPVTVLQGDTVVLRCFFYGYPTPTITWMILNSQQPISAANGTYNTTFRIDSVQMSDDGVTYVCQGRIPGNSNPTSENFQLIVDVVPTFNENDTRPVDTNVTIGDTVTFECRPTAKPAIAPDGIKWLANGKLLNANSLPARYSLSSDRTMLTITDVCMECSDGSSDFMTVTCNASNTHGYVLGEGYMNILYPTSISVPLAAQTVPANEPAEFTCSAETDATTPLMFDWLFNGTVINTVPGQVETYCNSTSCTLYIAKLQKSDQGTYTCIATNGYSQSETSAFLQVDPALYVFTVAEIWWVFLLIGLLLLLLLLLLFCFCYCKDNEGDTYPVDEIEVKNGNNPQKELRDTGFHDFQPPRGAVTANNYQVWTVGGTGGGGTGSVRGSKYSADAPSVSGFPRGGSGDVIVAGGQHQLSLAPPPPLYLPPQPPAFGAGNYQQGDADSSSSSDGGRYPAGPPNVIVGSRPITPHSAAVVGGRPPTLILAGPGPAQHWTTDNEPPERDMSPYSPAAGYIPGIQRGGGYYDDDAGPGYAPYNAAGGPGIGGGAGLYGSPHPSDLMGRYTPNHGPLGAAAYRDPGDVGFDGHGYAQYHAASVRRPPSESSV